MMSTSVKEKKARCRGGAGAVGGPAGKGKGCQVVMGGTVY